MNALLLLINIEIPPTAGVGSRFLSPSHLQAIELAVDGEPWGAFAPEEGGTPAEAGALIGEFSTYSEPAPVLVVARAGAALFAESAPPATAGEWARLLGRFLSPGGHVGVLEGVSLRDDTGATVDFSPRLPVPFTTAEFDESAYLGEITVALRLETP